MLNDFKCGCRVYLACGYTDLRKGIDGLAGLVQQEFHLDPFQEALFLFQQAPRLSRADEDWVVKLLPENMPKEFRNS